MTIRLGSSTEIVGRADPIGRDAPDAVLAPDGKLLRCHVFLAGERVLAPENLADLSEVLKQEHVFVWLDVVDPAPEDLVLLQEEFDLHPLAIEDAVQAHERPKIEAYGSYWFIVAQGVTMGQDEQLRFHEMAVFAGQKFVATVRHTPAYPLDEIERRWLGNRPHLRHDSGFLLYTILDTVVDGYLLVTRSIEDRVGRLEEALFKRQPLEDEVLLRIFDMKRNLQEFRGAALPMRDILNPIIRGDLTLFPGDEVAYYRDVYDHAVRVIDQLDAARDLTSSALDVHAAFLANQQGEVSKRLTIVATIFLPLTFVTGFFGQNFGWLISHITGDASFWFLGLGGEILAVAALLVYFKRKGWF